MKFAWMGAAVLVLSSSASASAATCPSSVTCAPPPLQTTTRPWLRSIQTKLTKLQGAPNHRGRDLMVTPSEPQIIIAKFAYGKLDKDLEGEDVDIYVQRDCAAWEKLGSSTTFTKAGTAAVTPYETVQLESGMIRFEIPTAKRLGAGRHRLRAVVAGDGTFAEVYVDVVPVGTTLLVSDIDGTLTSSENAELPAFVQGVLPEAHPDAGKALSLLATKGYRPFYLTARPSWLANRARQFLEVSGLPQGVVRVAANRLGYTGNAARDYKIKELSYLTARGFTLKFGFGNKQSDVEAYATTAIPSAQRYFYQLTGSFAGTTIQTYTELLTPFAKASTICK